MTCRSLILLVNSLVFRNVALRVPCVDAAGANPHLSVMTPGLIIPIALLVVPILEIAVFILIGGEIGLWPTLAMIFVTAVIGTILLRTQGFALFVRIRQETEAGHVPGRQLVHAGMILVAGILLLTPGFVTDAIGFLLFVPPLRDALWRWIGNKFTVNVVNSGTRTGRSAVHPESRVVELDDREWSADPDPSSPWRPGDKE
jgi:UPF0716 protein FxsA